MVSTVSLRIDDDHAGVRARPEVGTARRAVAARADLYDSYAARCLADDPGRARAPALPDQAALQLASTNLLERSLGEVRRRHHGDRPDPGETSCLALVWAALDLYITHATNGVGFPAANASTYLRDAFALHADPALDRRRLGPCAHALGYRGHCHEVVVLVPWPASMRSSECGVRLTGGRGRCVDHALRKLWQGRRRGRP
jgi:hypothetical protein